MADRRIRYRVREKLKDLQPRLVGHNVLIGDQRTGEVETGYDGRININVDGIAAAVVNYRGITALNTPARIGRDPFTGKFMQVLGGRFLPGSPGGGGSLEVAPHALTHHWPEGSDIAYIETEQIMLLHCGVKTVGTMTVTVKMGCAIIESAVYQISETDIDLTSYVPTTTARSRWALIYIDNNGNLAQLYGHEIASASIALTDIDWPGMPFFPIAAILLYQGQTAVIQNTTTNHVVDLRFRMGVGAFGNKVLVYNGNVVTHNDEIVWS